jgi:hypothetical protein
MSDCVPRGSQAQSTTSTLYAFVARSFSASSDHADTLSQFYEHALAYWIAHPTSLFLQKRPLPGCRDGSRALVAQSLLHVMAGNGVHRADACGRKLRGRCYGDVCQSDGIRLLVSEQLAASMPALLNWQGMDVS